MSQNGALLLVEDESAEVEVALRAFDRAGLATRVVVASDGLEALEVLGLESNGTPREAPRVVFLDLKMPRVDGWEVLRRMRAHPSTADVPVVVLSSSDRPEEIERCYAMGANSYLVKRYDARRPGQYIAEAARYWLELNRVAKGRSA